MTTAVYSTTSVTSQRSISSGIDFIRKAAIRTAGMPPSAMPSTILRSSFPAWTWRLATITPDSPALAAMMGKQ